MKAKVKILHLPDQLFSFNADWMQWINDLLEFEQYDENSAYPAGTLFYVKDIKSHLHNVDGLLDRGFKIVYDNLWELYSPPKFPAHVMHNPSWFWYNESLWYQHLALDQYQPARTYEYLALMPMRLNKPHRTRLVESLGSTLDQMIWSYVDQGRQLPNDGDMSDWNTQRYFNPDWYNQTHYSIVAETYADHHDQQPVFITEKTFKAMAFQHPFIIYGNRNTLNTLQELGFATYDNLWSEHYDQILDPLARGHAIVDIIKQIEPVPHSKLTLEKITHNRDRFFDSALIRTRILNEIINPIIEYAET